MIRAWHADISQVKYMDAFKAVHENKPRKIMNKFETILKLSEIKGVAWSSEHPESILIPKMISELIDDLSQEFRDGYQDEYQKCDNSPASCSHEGDGCDYQVNPPLNRCRKCSEFYR